ncbi:MAG: redoxin domain-containing protein [Chloroflexi bacterium]|nr:redoxin domain-containing protein [Chloroflexota bacterium]
MTLQLGSPVPDFELTDIHGKTHRLSDYRGRIVIVNFWSYECPHSERIDKAILAMFVQHMHRAADAVQVWQDDVSMLTIASNLNETAEAVKTVSEARRLPNVLMDANCRVANLFEAQTTPHVFVIDREGILRYRGAVDDVTFRQRTPSRFFLNEAVESLLAGQFPTLTESPAYGCTIVREI